MSQDKFLPPRGFRDVSPEEAKKREIVIRTAEDLATSFGFVPIETPAVEYKSTLMGKYGEEADKLIFEFTDRGGRQVALRYDQTVPLARYINRFRPSLPFKRYQIQSSFRAEKPQKGRYREFVQIDFDIVGDATFSSDAEVLWLTAALFDKLNLPVTLVYNSRQLLYSLFEAAKVPSPKYSRTAQLVDKLDKLPRQEVEKQLMESGLEEKSISKLWRLFDEAQPNSELLQIINLVKPVVKVKFEFSPYLVRGLDYYTGLIFEVKTQKGDKSLAGGGRYDSLIKQDGRYLPAVGVGIGLDRLVEVLAANEIERKGIEVGVLVLDSMAFEYAFKVIQILRQKGKVVYLYPRPEDALKKGMKQLLTLGAKEVVFIGPEEVEGSFITWKDLAKREQKRIKLANL